ncbi:hypothetical protein FRC00_014655, partial [Tulasnella sp. 408]
MEAYPMQRSQRRVPPVDNSNETYSRYPTPATVNSRVAFALDDGAPVDRPFSAQSIQSRGTYSSNRSIGSPPSLVSAREGLATLSTTSRSAGRSSPRSPPPHAFAGNSSKKMNNQRHLSLPPAFPSGPRPGQPAIFAATAGSIDGHSTHSDPFQQPGDYDIRQFPKWSRDWYSNTPNGTTKNNGTTFPIPGNEQQESDLGVWPPQAAPTYPTYPYSSQFPQSSAQDVSSPSTLPWGTSASHLTNPDDQVQYVSDSVKEERMRMLEREFGNKNGKGKEKMDDGTQVGSVDEEGVLITSGPRRRSAARWTQTILACGGAAAGIYGAVAIHPTTPAPPAGKPPAYVLYVLSVATFVFAIWFFHIRPCMRRRRRRKTDKYTQKMNPAGMMVLPIVQGLGGKGKKKKGKDMQYGMGGPPGKKGKKKKGDPGAGQGVQVNLIVDPTMFGGNGTGRGSRRKGGEEDDASDEYQASDEERSTVTRSKRRGVYQGLQMEQDWKAARKRLKWQIFVDIMLMIVWTAAAFY